MFRNSRFVCTAAFVLVVAGLGQGVAGSEPSGPDTSSVDAFIKQGFKVTYRDREGHEIPRAEFERHSRDEPIAMRVDGDAKTVSIALSDEDAALPVVPVAIEPGAPLPPHPLHDLAGAAHPWPRSDGKYTLLDFYFSGCGPCIQAIPELNAFRTAHPEFATLAVTFDDADESRRFAAERKLAWDIVPGARDFIEALGVSVYPTVMLVDAQGRLVAVRQASLHGDEAQSLQAWVDAVLPPRR